MTPLRLLIAEDSEDDVLLLLAQLRKSGFEPAYERVDTENLLLNALKKDHWDIVLSDYMMPLLNGLDVLRLTQASRKDIPVILVSGKIGEEIAVEALHAGAYDYVMKEHLQRLGSAVHRALDEHALRKERAAAQLVIYARNRQQSAVAELGVRALTGIGVTELMQEAAVLVAGVLEVQLCQVLEILTDRSGLILRAGVGCKKEHIGKAIIPMCSASQAALTVQSAGPVIVKDLAIDARFSDSGLLTDPKPTSGLSVPISGNNSPFGVFAIYTTHPHEFSDTDILFVQSVANLLGIAIERRHTEEESMHAQKMESLGRLAGGVAHDFNNILTVITGYSELVLSRVSPQDLTYRDLQEIKHSAEQATALTRQLLVFSRKQVARPRVLQVNAVIDGMQNMLQRLIGEDISLSTLLAPQAGHIKIDPGHIQQILMNLSVNARDAMPQGGKLVIQTGNRDHFAFLSMADTGCGMSTDTQTHLFEPFFTTKEQGKGTGLGLATVYAIVRQAGGRIEVESYLGKGSTFKIFLPSVDEAVELPSVSKAPKSLQGTETVLVVEDEEVIRTLAHRVLGEKGYRVLEARHGEEALALCEGSHDPIDLVLTDMVMPQMSGRQFIDSFSKKNPQTKVLYMSGYTDRMAEERGLLTDGMNFLQKPFSPQDLVIRVRELLDEGAVAACTIEAEKSQ